MFEFKLYPDIEIAKKLKIAAKIRCHDTGKFSHTLVKQLYSVINSPNIFGKFWWENFERVIIYTAKKAMAGTDANVGISLWDEENS